MSSITIKRTYNMGAFPKTGTKTAATTFKKTMHHRLGRTVLLVSAPLQGGAEDAPAGNEVYARSLEK